MNSKMTTNSQLSETEPKKKKKLSKQLEQEQNYEMEITWRGISGGEGQKGERYRISSKNGR